MNDEPVEKYTKNFDSWNERQKLLDATEFQGLLHNREIWWCALGVNVGSEQDGKNDYFERPVLVIRYTRKDVVLIVPITSKISNHKDRITFNIAGLKQQILLSQIKTVSNKRFLRKIGRLGVQLFQEVLIALGQIILNSADDETPP